MSLDPACMCVSVYFFIEAMLFDMFQLRVDLWVCVYMCVCVRVCVRCRAEQCFSAACSMTSLEMLTGLLLPVKHENNSLCERRVTVGATPHAEKSLECVCMYVCNLPICRGVYLRLCLSVSTAKLVLCI